MLPKDKYLAMLEGGGGKSTSGQQSEPKPQTEPKQEPVSEPQKPETPAAHTGYAGSGTAIPTFESLFSDMMARYMPETVTFTPMDEETIRSMLMEWIRPAYEQAIRNRRELTARYNAELDADAWARGMGESTYVTDVKSRAYANEARDVGDLESDYAATLASRLFDAMQTQQEEQIKVDQFNAEQMNRAKERATEAANALYQAYVNAAKSSGSRTASSAKSESKQTATSDKSLDASQSAPAVSLNEAINLIARLSPENRRALYTGSGSYAQMYREILTGIGSDAFRKLMQKYPAA